MLTSNWICLRIVLWNNCIFRLFYWLAQKSLNRMKFLGRIESGSFVRATQIFICKEDRKSLADRTSSQSFGIKFAWLNFFLFWRRLFESGQFDSFFFDFFTFMRSFEFILLIVSVAGILWPFRWFYPPERKNTHIESIFPNIGTHVIVLQPVQLLAKIWMLFRFQQKVKLWKRTEIEKIPFICLLEAVHSKSHFLI